MFSASSLNIAGTMTAKVQPQKLKRNTKIDQWNILCRWAFCRSLAEPTPPSPVPIPQDSNSEMTWRVFGGEISYVLRLVLKHRWHNDGQSPTSKAQTQHQNRPMEYSLSLGILSFPRRTNST